MLNEEYQMLVKYDLDDKGTGHVFERKNVIASCQSEYQKIEISDLDILGRVLVLDNIIQLSQLDCDRYHESFAHIPMSKISDPSRVLILGGGDGILAKELLKYENLEIDLVDIDPEVIRLSKLHLNCLNSGSLEDPRVKVHCVDALKFCAVSKGNYDVIYADITDPHPDSPSSSLLGPKAIDTYKKLLTPGGIFVAQTDNIQIAPEHKENICKVLRKKFSNVGNFGIVALTLSSLFSFSWASNELILGASTIEVETNWLSTEKTKFCFEVLEIA